MRWIVFWGAGLGLLIGCATPTPESPIEARTVNADMEQLISATVEEGKSLGFPDLKEARVEAPAIAGKKQRKEQAGRLEAEGDVLRQETNEKREQAVADDVAERKAEALRKQIERDRQAAARDKKLSETAQDWAKP